VAKKGHEERLDIPDFLRVENRPKSKRRKENATSTTVAPPTAEPIDPRLTALSPPVREYVEELVRTGRAQLHWLDDPGTIKTFEEKVRLREERRERERLALARKRENFPKKTSPLKGLVPLHQILKEMGGSAPKRRHARAAVDEAKLEHTKYHFQPGEVTLARVRQVISRYQPPQRGRGKRPDFPEAAIIRWVGGANPKKAGSAPHERWELLIAHSGRSVGQFVAAGGNTQTLANAIKGGYAQLQEAAGAAAVPAAPKGGPEAATSGKLVKKGKAKKEKKRGKKSRRR
jgi:hypothetical protein